MFPFVFVQGRRVDFLQSGYGSFSLPPLIRMNALYMRLIDSECLVIIHWADERRNSWIIGHCHVLYTVFRLCQWLGHTRFWGTRLHWLICMPWLDVTSHCASFKRTRLNRLNVGKQINCTSRHHVPLPQMKSGVDNVLSPHWIPHLFYHIGAYPAIYGSAIRAADTKAYG